MRPRIMRPWLATAVLLGGLHLVTGVVLPVSAQETGTDALLPKTEPGSGVSSGSVTNTARPTGQDTPSAEILAPAITAISLTQWDGASAISEGSPGEGAQVQLPFIGAASEAAMARYLAARIGEPLSLAKIDELNRELISLAAEAGYPVVDVLAPAGQDVSKGVIRLLMVPGLLEDVEVTGAGFFSPESTLNSLVIRTGEVVSAKRLAKNMNWLNRNPYRQANTVLKRGSQPGQTRVEIQVKDRKPYRVYAGAENNGTELTGEERVFIGFNHGNLAGRGHQLGLQATTSTESGDFNAQSFNYVVPLPWQHEFSVVGVSQESDPPEDADGFDLSAKTTQVGLRYEIPLTSRGSLSTGLLQSVAFHYDAKESNNDLLFGGSSVLDNETDVSQFGVLYRFSRPDNAGKTSGSLDFVSSIDQDDQAENFAAQRALATTDYQYVRASLDRSTRLGAAASWQIRLSGQWADSNLLPSEQFGIGGSRTVRGDDEFARLGDRGAVVNNEFHYLLGSRRHPVDTFVFYDWGTVSNVDLLQGEQDGGDLSSWGIGLNYVHKGNIRFSLSHGWQLEAPDPDADKSDRTHVSLLISF